MRLARAIALCAWLAAAASAHAAERVLALAPHVCEMLFAIGAGREIVGAVDYCDYPPAARALPRVGNYRAVHAEAALRLRPTLAIAMSPNISGLDTLKRFGVRVIVSDPKTVHEVGDEMARLGAILGHADEASAFVRRWHARLAELERTIPRPALRVFYEIWPSPLMAAGGRTFLNDVIRLAGGQNVFAAIALEAPRISAEAVVRAQPDAIVIPTEKRDLAARRAFWRRLLGARVCVVGVPFDALHRPGPRLLDGVVILREALSRCRH